MDTEKIKRGRRKKVVSELNPEQTTNNIQIILEEPEIQDKSENVAKKRGRKPKGGKLILKQPDTNLVSSVVPNVILHLKCSLHDLNEFNDKINEMVTDPLLYNPVIPLNILTYNTDNNKSFSVYENNAANTKVVESNPSENINFAYSETGVCKKCKGCMNNISDDPALSSVDCDEIEESQLSMKDINSKLKKLKIQLHKNSIQDKKSACFWCSYEFDNPPCYIPKYEMDKTICGYGSFCRPECAVGFLMKENIDDSTKFERYHLLNQIYSKIYDYKKNIKPAPNPFYLLDKYYGNLSIQEYRKLLKTEHMLLVIDKPLTRILPELHEDNDEFILNIYGESTKTSQSSSQNGGVYKVKRQSEKIQGPTKSSIMRDKFGLSA